MIKLKIDARVVSEEETIKPPGSPIAVGRRGGEHQNQINTYIATAITLHESLRLAESFQQIMLAVKLQSNIAMILAGLALQHSWGVVQDRELGFKYYAKAVRQICKQASLRELHPNKMHHLSEALKQELSLVVWEIATCLRFGWGIKKNKQYAAFYYRIGAELGDCESQNMLAQMYLTGKGVPKSKYLAARWYRIAEKTDKGFPGNNWIHKEKYTGSPIKNTDIETWDIPNVPMIHGSASITPEFDQRETPPPVII